MFNKTTRITSKILSSTSKRLDKMGEAMNEAFKGFDEAG